MKRILFILCIITSSFVLTSCKTVIITSADRVVSSSWSVSTQAGISAELSFDKKTYMASLLITDENENRSVIEGVFAIDSQNIYITSADFGKTYCFGYKAYNDRLELEYDDTVLVFNAEEK